MVENKKKPATYSFNNKVAVAVATDESQAPVATDAKAQKTQNTSEDSTNIPVAADKNPGLVEKGQSDRVLIYNKENEIAEIEEEKKK